MNPSADVRSIGELQDFRAALIGFRTDALEALFSIDEAVRRANDWLSDQLKGWQRLARTTEDEVVQAKAELAMRRWPEQSTGRIPDTSVQEKKLRAAKAKLE